MEKIMLTNKQIIKIRKGFNGIGQRVIFKILGDRNRYRIFEMLAKYPLLSVTEVAEVLEISIPLSSQHLKILVNGGMLDKEKLGQKVFYKLKQNNLIAQAIVADIL
jgi:DNA-binding transcriptional ArsR family regulator